MSGMQCRFVGEEAVRQLAVLAERFAVIAGHHDKRRSRRTARGGQQGSERLIHRRDLAGMRLRGVSRSKGAGGR
jgi:hypothetical protein